MVADDRGATAIEYALIGGIMAVVVAGGVLGLDFENHFSTVTTFITDALAEDGT